MKMANTEKAETRPFPKKNSGLVYGLAMDRLQTQQQQIEALDGKIGNLLGFSSALVAIMAALLALTDNDIPSHALAFICIAGVSYLAIAIGSPIAYYARTWEVGPKLDEAWRYAREWNEEEMTWWAAESLTQCYQKNQGKVKLKVRVANVNVVLMGLQTMSVVLGLGFVTMN